LRRTPGVAAAVTAGACAGAAGLAGAAPRPRN